MAAAAKATEAEIVDLLRRRYCQDSGNGPAAVLLPQVRNAAGFDATRTADALVMQLWPSRGLHLEGFEVKCSRSDVLKELRQPEKAETIARWCEKWWLVLADGSHIKEGELPDEWGLMVRTAKGDKLHTVKAAPLRQVPKELPKTFLAALLRQADREANRPAELALKAARDEGYEAGVRSAGYAARDLERLRGKVKEFEEATGLRVDTWDERLHEQAALVRVLLGDGRSWDGVMARLDRLAKVAGELHADLSGLGLGRPK